MKWAVIGTGARAELAVKSLGGPDRVVCIGSGSIARAEAFAKRYGICEFGLRDEAASHVGVDAVFVACSNRDHASACIIALLSGKRVVCEAPLAVNAAETELVLTFAAEQRLFITEVCTIPFVPTLTSALTEARGLGTVFRIHVVTSQVTSGPALLTRCGGAWMSTATAFSCLVSSLIYHRPTDVVTTTVETEPAPLPLRSDSCTTVSLRYGSDLRADITCRIGDHHISDNILEMRLTRGSVVVEGGQPLQFPVRHTVYAGSQDYIPDHASREGDTPIVVMRAFFRHVEDAIEKGFLESDKWTHENTRRAVALSDQVRTQLGLVFPCEVEE